MHVKQLSRMMILVIALSQSVFAQAQQKQVRVYVDMVADLFHAGHIAFIKQARQFGNYLIVGVHNDADCAGYKRLPILTMEERIEEISACRYVDEVYPNAPLVLTDEVIDKLKIDIVVHGDDFNEEKMKKYYSAPARRGMMRTVPYTKGISTTEILNRIMSRLPSELVAK